MDPARTFRSAEFEAPDAFADPLPVPGPADSAGAPRPFWGRFARAVGLLLVASAAHLWLVREPEPAQTRPAGAAAQSVSGRAASLASPAPQPSGVDVITELVPVGTTGQMPPSAAEPDLIPTPAATVEANDAPGHAPAAIADARHDEPAAAPAPSRAASVPIAQPLSLTHRLSSVPPLEVPSIPLTPAAAPVRAPASAMSPAGTPRPGARHAETDQQQMVRQLLQEYVAAFESLNVEAAKAVWPTVDGKALRRAFDQLDTQHLTFQSCGITIEGSGANARCQGQAAYRPRIGSHTLRISPREWTFNLAKADEGWQIVDARVR